MEARTRELIAQGEGMGVEFKRCGSLPEKDVYETVCAFANRQGGHILLGVLDDGTVEGVNENAQLDIERNMVSVTSNPKLFSSAPLLEFDRVVLDGSHIIDVWVPMGPAVYRFKGEVYDRMADADVRLRGDDQISALYLRKRNAYTEQRVYPYVEESDMRMDLLARVREMAKANRPGHPWASMSDGELLGSARLYVTDRETGRRGFTLAAVMLLGADDTISEVVPAYRTDALLRRVDTDRYDDRLTVRTNLIESYDALVGFCGRWIPDSFVLDGDQRVGARDVIARELVANCLVHREFSSPFLSQLVIDAEGIHTRNPSRCLFAGRISPENLSPVPKNPAIADFFTQIGLAEELGSGTRNLYRCSKLLTGSEPVLDDGDFFEAFVPLPEIFGSQVANDGKKTLHARVGAAVDELTDEHGVVTVREVADYLGEGVSSRTIRRHLQQLVDEGRLSVEGETRSTRYRKI